MAIDTGRETTILDRCVQGLRLKLSLNETQCYPVAVPAYIPSMPERVLQVQMGATRPYGVGDGEQAGGNRIREGTITVAVFVRVKMDPHGKSRQGLMNAAKGLELLLDQVEAVFEYTVLGDGMLNEPLTWVGNSENEVVNADEGIFMARSMWRAVWAKMIDTSVLSLQETDFVPGA